MTKVSPKRLDSALLESVAALAPLTAGDILYATGADTLAKLPKGAADKVLKMAADGSLPSWRDDIGAVSEGTFTPGITFGDAAVGMTFSSRDGAWWRIGKRVFVQLRCNLSAKGSSTGIARISGLPFVPLSGKTFSAPIYCAGMTGLTGKVSGTVTGTNTGIILYQSSATGEALLTDTAFTNTSDIRLSFEYITDDP